MAESIKMNMLDVSFLSSCSASHKWMTEIEPGWQKDGRKIEMLHSINHPTSVISCFVYRSPSSTARLHEGTRIPGQDGRKTRAR